MFSKHTKIEFICCHLNQTIISFCKKIDENFKFTIQSNHRKTNRIKKKKNDTFLTILLLSFLGELFKLQANLEMKHD